MLLETAAISDQGGVTAGCYAMFQFFNYLSRFDESLIEHLEHRLRDSGTLCEPTALGMDRDSLTRVVLFSAHRGMGVVHHSFPASLVREPRRLPELDLAIDIFLGCWPGLEVSPKSASLTLGRKR